MLHATGEVLDSGHRAVIFPLWSVQLHSSPQSAGELGATAEPQGPHLSTIKERENTQRDQSSEIHEGVLGRPQCGLAESQLTAAAFSTAHSSIARHPNGAGVVHLYFSSPGKTR